MVKHEDLDIQRCKAILKVRAKLLEAARSWLNSQGFTEVQGPILLPRFGERPLNFKVNYFDQDAYLTGGLQPYSDTFLEMFGKIYTIAPTFRADRLKSNRHLAEYWRIEAYALGCNLAQIMHIQEEMTTYVCHMISKEATEALRLLHSPVKSIMQVNAPFPKITYDEAIERLQQTGCRIYWGQPLDWDAEHQLSLMFKTPFFISELPISEETFFHKSHPEKPELSLYVDLLAPYGYGEISSGGEEITDKQILCRKLKYLNIDSADRKWILNLKRFHSTPQSGFAMGIERLLRWICKVENIKDTVAFPRSYE